MQNKEKTQVGIIIIQDFFYLYCFINLSFCSKFILFKILTHLISFLVTANFENSINNSAVVDTEADTDNLDDLDYQPSNGSENGSVDDNGYNESDNRERDQNSNGHLSHDISISANVPGKSTRDDAGMFVACATGRKALDRKSYCMYCQTMQTKFVRHLENKHKDVDEVKKFAVLPKGNPERLKIIETIRRKCMFDFNTNNAINDGELMVCRRPSANKPQPATHFKICQNCKGFFSKNNLRHHAKRCFGHSGKTNRTLSVLGRKILGRIHPDASELLRQEIFPVLREDDIVRLIRYDRLIILYGNKLSAKYGGSQKQHDMIRSQLRLLGRFLKALKRINNQITDFASIYHPQIYDDAISAIHEIAGLDSKTKNYGAPSTAFAMGTLLRKTANFYVSDCIKRQDREQQGQAEDFLKLLKEDIAVSVNKPVADTQALQRRRKKVELPSSKDIQTLRDYLKEKRTAAFKSLNQGFRLETWLTLAKTTLTSMQLFNRRRAGEIEQISIDDFQNYQRINKEDLQKMSKESQKIANEYVRFTIRGKRGFPVPVLLSTDLFQCVETILEYREQANVPSKNRYVFGIASTDPVRLKWLSACRLMREFVQESNVKFPENITGTTLRKHIATNCINLNLSENEVADVAKFMGHSDKIHKDHYRQSIVSREILRMSKVLEQAQYCEEDDDPNNDSDSRTDDEDIEQELDCKLYNINYLSKNSESKRLKYRICVLRQSFFYLIR